MSEKKDFIFKVTVREAEGDAGKKGATNVSMEIGDQKDVSLNEAVGSMVHLVMTENNKLFLKYLEDHKDLTPDQIDAEKYSLIAQNLISFQIITFNIIREIFGDIDPVKLTAAEQEIRGIAEKTMNKNFKSKK